MNLTEAAQRVLRESALLAGTQGERAILPIHLLAALAGEESRGNEVLVQLGLDRRDLASMIADASGDPPLPAERVGVSAAVKAILQAAHLKAGENGRGTEVGSEHLVWGLAETPHELSEFLASRGITPECVAPLIGPDAPGEPISILVEEVLQTAAASQHGIADAWRILDAAANRCAEGLRVVEDVVRFSRNDPFASRLLKEFRHELGHLLSELKADHRLEMRDTPHDVGTGISTRSEQHRESWGDLLTANFKRSEEALRSLEEVSKLLGPELADFSRGMEALRYRLYTIEKTVLRAHALAVRLHDARLYLLVTQALCKTSAEQVIRESIVNGVDVVQLREKSLTDREFVRYARDARQWTAQHGTLLVINDRADIAALCEADGVHLGQEDVGVAQARRILGPGKLVGVSTHEIEQARRAVLDGADYLGVGPTFVSGTKNFPDGYSGTKYLNEIAAEFTIPWFAIGGIDATNLAEAMAAGASRVAVCGAICGSTEPGYAAAKLSRKLMLSPAAES